MTDELTNVAIKLGVSQSVASDLVSAMLEQIKKYAGGGVIYVKKPSKEKRNHRIIAMYNGVNKEEVCGEFNISAATLYRILKSQ